MSGMQHERIGELSAELRLAAVPDLYVAAAQAAAARDASFSDFLEEILRGEREVRRARARSRVPVRPWSQPATRRRISVVVSAAACCPVRAAAGTSVRWPIRHRSGRLRRVGPGAQAAPERRGSTSAASKDVRHPSNAVDRRNSPSYGSTRSRSKVGS